MNGARTRAILLCATTLAGLAACAGGPKAEAPGGLSLAGNWKLNHTASTDPQQVIARMYAEADRILRRRAIQADSSGMGGGMRGGRPGAPGAGGQSADATQPIGGDESGPGAGGSGAGRPDPLRHSPMMHVLTQIIERGDYLAVRQSSEEFVLDYGTTVRSFTPGQHSVVSAEGGVADQVSGWNGREYVITDKAQIGPNVVERYGLSSDGKQLIDKLRIGPGELPAIELTRVYDHTDEVAPRAPPSTD